ncbi:hypothetical protein [Parapedobacter sp. 10938]|uniref:hypothetical protein n=1 Tax=Parapedobacter flavus TaxID=3110225 RepID=UPI002DB5D634|nr:hypothetical protein [Parapedobacter sp. 10938]MEC3881403.1 hypothetical protein [Parapedobacter sp. 10938]
MIEELLRTKSDRVLAEVEAVLKRAEKPIKTRKLSEKYAGSLNLTNEQYTAFQNQISEGRNEWERDI